MRTIYIYYKILLFSILSSSLSILLRGIFEHHTANRGMGARGKPRLPWLLLLVAVTAVLPSNAVYNDNDIKFIVKNVVENNPLFTNFPQTEYNPTGTQFAVLILISRQDYAKGNTNIELIPVPTRRNINNHYPVQPGPRVRVNYMVARPDSPYFNQAGREHSEKKLLDNLEQMLQKFGAWHKEPPAMVLLYTWATPCPKCTEELLNAKKVLRQMYPRSAIHFTVTYSVDREWRNSGMTFEVNKNNRKRLQDFGIRVLQIYENTMGPTPSSTNFGGMNNVPKHIRFDKPSSTDTTTMPQHIIFTEPPSTGQHTATMPRHSKDQKLHRPNRLLANRRFNNNPPKNQPTQRSSDRIVRHPMSKVRHSKVRKLHRLNVLAKKRFPQHNRHPRG